MGDTAKEEKRSCEREDFRFVVLDMGACASCDSRAKFAFQEPRAPPAGVVPGYVGCVAGALVPSGASLVSPVTGVPCVWARLIVWQPWRHRVINVHDGGFSPGARDVRRVTSHFEDGWKRCADITRVVDARLVAGGVALRIASTDALMVAADCATAETGVSEGKLAKAEDGDGGPKAGATLPAAVRAVVAQHRFKHSGIQQVTDNEDYRFTEIVVLPHAPVAALGAVVAEGIDQELRLVPASYAWDNERKKYAPPFPEARAALPPRAQRGWTALEAKLGDKNVFLACGRPSSDADAEAGGVAFDDVSDWARGYNSVSHTFEGNDWQAPDKNPWLGPAVPVSFNPDGQLSPYPLRQVRAFKHDWVKSAWGACWDAYC